MPLYGWLFRISWLCRNELSKPLVRSSTKSNFSFFFNKKKSCFFHKENTTRKIMYILKLCIAFQKKMSIVVATCLVQPGEKWCVYYQWTVTVEESYALQLLYTCVSAGLLYSRCPRPSARFKILLAWRTIVPYLCMAYDCSGTLVSCSKRWLIKKVK